MESKRRQYGRRGPRKPIKRNPPLTGSLLQRVPPAIRKLPPIKPIPIKRVYMPQTSAKKVGNSLPIVKETSILRSAIEENNEYTVQKYKIVSSNGDIIGMDTLYGIDNDFTISGDNNTNNADAVTIKRTVHKTFSERSTPFTRNSILRRSLPQNLLRKTTGYDNTENQVFSKDDIFKIEDVKKSNKDIFDDERPIKDSGIRLTSPTLVNKCIKEKKLRFKSDDDIYDLNKDILNGAEMQNKWNNTETKRSSYSVNSSFDDVDNYIENFITKLPGEKAEGSDIGRKIHLRDQLNRSFEYPLKRESFKGNRSFEEESTETVIIKRCYTEETPVRFSTSIKMNNEPKRITADDNSHLETIGSTKIRREIPININKSNGDLRKWSLQRTGSFNKKEAPLVYKEDKTTSERIEKNIKFRTLPNRTKSNYDLTKRYSLPEAILNRNSPIMDGRSVFNANISGNQARKSTPIEVKHFSSAKSNTVFDKSVIVHEAPQDGCVMKPTPASRASQSTPNCSMSPASSINGNEFPNPKMKEIKVQHITVNQNPIIKPPTERVSRVPSYIASHSMPRMGFHAPINGRRSLSDQDTSMDIMDTSTDSVCTTCSTPVEELFLKHKW